MQQETLQLEREFDAPPERVFEVFTTPALLRQWHCGKVAEVIMELRPGGRFMIRFAKDSNLSDERCVRGVYQEVEIPKRLVYTWKWDGSEEESLVLAEFLPSTRGALLKIEHRRFASRASLEGHANGWHDCLAGLEKYIRDPDGNTIELYSES